MYLTKWGIPAVKSKSYKNHREADIKYFINQCLSLHALAINVWSGENIHKN